jgi:hypothetical protein
MDLKGIDRLQIPAVYLLPLNVKFYANGEDKFISLDIKIVKKMSA